MFVPAGGVNGLELSLVHLDGNNLGTYGWYGKDGNKARLLNVLVDRFTTCGIYFNQGLCELRQSYVRNNMGTGVRVYSDSWISGSEIGSNVGVGLIVASGGTASPTISSTPTIRTAFTSPASPRTTTSSTP